MLYDLTPGSRVIIVTTAYSNDEYRSSGSIAGKKHDLLYSELYFIDGIAKKYCYDDYI